MDSIIIYQSRYGATRQYAEMLSAARGIPIFHIDNIQMLQVEKADFIILATPVYLGKILLKEFLQNNLKILIHKKLAMLVISASPDKKPDFHNSLIEANVPAEIRSQTSYFFLRGKVKYEELSWRDKFLLRIGALFQTRKNKAMMLTDFNDISAPALEPVLSFITNMRQVDPLVNHS